MKVELLATYGGVDLTKTVKQILERMMVDSVASLYSNKGLRGKLSFSGVLPTINASIFGNYTVESFVFTKLHSLLLSKSAKFLTIFYIDACRKNKRFKDSVTWTEYETALIGALKNAADRVGQRQR
jgi:hypothetical protein